MQDYVRARRTEPVKRRLADLKARQIENTRALDQRLKALRDQHLKERGTLSTRQHEQFKADERKRADRLRKGPMGLFDRVSGKRGKISEQNARERQEQKERHQQERQALRDRQIDERGGLQKEIAEQRDRQQRERRVLRAELATVIGPAPEQDRGRAAGRERLSRNRDDIVNRAGEGPVPDSGPDPDSLTREFTERSSARDDRPDGSRSRGRGRGHDDGREMAP